MLFTKTGRLLILIPSLILIFSWAQAQDNLIHYNFKKVPLSEGLNYLINHYQIPILYINQGIDSITISAKCKICTENEALNNLLEKTSLQWKNVNGQILVYDATAESVIDRAEMAQAQQYSIEGFIIDSLSNEPLPYAAISIEGTGLGAVSDSTGYFTIQKLSAKKYHLNILYIGYQPEIFVADLRKKASIKVEEIPLNPKNIELDAIIIRKARIHTQATINNTSVVVFDPLKLKTTPTMDQGDIVQNIRLVSGVNIIPDDPMGINLRGGSSDQTLILFDRIPVYHTQHLMGFNGLLNANCAEQIHLHSGGFSAQYGDRLSGVLTIKGENGNKQKIYGGLSANLYTTRAYLNIPLGKKVNLYTTVNKSSDWFDISERFLLRGDYSYFNMYDQVKYSGKYGTGFYAQGLQGNDYQVSQTRFGDVTSKISYRLSKKDTLSATFLHSTDQVDIQNSLNGIEQKAGERSEKWQSRGLNLNYQRKWGSGFNTNLGAVYADFENNTIFRYSEDSLPRTDFTNENLVEHREFYLNTDLKISDKINWLGGFSFTHLKTKLDRFDQSDTLLVQSFHNQTLNKQQTLYTELLIKPGENFSVNAGFRANRNINLDVLDVDPRIALKAQFGNYLTFSFSGGVYRQYMHRTPSVVNYNISSIGPTGSWLYSQQNLKPSKAIHSLAGLNFDTEKYSMHVTLYYKMYNDLHLIIPAQMKIAYIDNANREKRSLYIDWIKNREIIMSGTHEIDIFSGQGYSKGLELIASKNKGIYTGFISYHLSRSKYQFAYMNLGKPFYPSYDHTHEIKSMNYLSYYHFNVGSIFYLVSGKPYPNKYPYKNYFDASELSLEHPINWEMQTTKRLPYYINTDVSISYDLEVFEGIKATLGLVVQNVLNTKQLISKYYTWTNIEEGEEPLLELQNQYSQGRLLNVFLSIDF